MFSMAMPIASVGAALFNVLELRCDAYKVLFQLQRPRYRGADGIGKWRDLLSAVSLVAVIVNAMLIVLTSTALRDHVIIPSLATADVCATAASPAELSDEAKHLGTNVSFASDCTPNFLQCYAHIGGEPWLPAYTYLTPKDVTTARYYQDGLCDAASPLHNADFCSLCDHRRSLVAWWQAWCLFFIEHILLAMHVLVSFAVPDKPAWVLAEAARNEFRKEQLVARLTRVGPPPPLPLPPLHAQAEARHPVLAERRNIQRRECAATRAASC